MGHQNRQTGLPLHRKAASQRIPILRIALTARKSYRFLRFEFSEMPFT
jgi:hypothetical protein